MSAGLLVVAEFSAGVSQQAAGGGLPGGVAEAGGGGQRGALGGCPFLVAPTYFQEGRHGPGQLPGVAVEPGLGGEGGGGEQDVVLGLEPGQRLPVIGGPFGNGAGPGRGE